MTAAPHTHLTADELDALHAGTTVARATSHLETCADCRLLLARDTRLIADLAALPTWDPSPQFVLSVMQRIDRPAAQPAAVPGPTDRARAARRRVLVGGALGVATVSGGFAWAFANPHLALGFAEPLFHDLTSTLWMSVQALSANTVEQPWFAPVRDALASPARAVPLLVGAAGLYTAALIGLRRLLTRPATDAGW